MGDMISTIDGLMDALGGQPKAAELAGISVSAISNWKAKGVVPPEYFVLFSEAALPAEIDRALFGFKAREVA